MDSFAEIKQTLFGKLICTTAESEIPQNCIMIIDDNIDIIQALTAVLQSHYKVFSCIGYEEAKKELTAEVAVVLLDIKMGVKDGLEVFNLLKERRADLPIIFHSAYSGSNEKAAAAQNLPHSGYLIKGEYNTTKLLDLIDHVLNQSDEGILPNLENRL